MEIEKQEINEPQTEYFLFSKKHDNIDVIIISSDDEEETTLKPKKKKQKLGFPRDNVDAFDELSKVVKWLPETKDDNDVASTADLCFSSTYLSEKKTGKKNVVESTTSNEKYGHVSLDDLGVSVEDLKSIPWEAFDPTWEIRSWANDPWLGGHIEDMFSPQNNSDT